MSLPLFLNTRLTVVETLWDLALAYFTVRTAAVYALVALAADALLAWAAGSAQARVALPLVPLRVLLAAACARAVVVRYEMPRDWWFRGAVGGVAGGMMAVVGGMLRAGGCGMGVEVGRMAVLAGVMPVALMLFEGKEGWEKEGKKQSEKGVGL